MPPMQRLLLIIGACLALALTGCGDDSNAYGSNYDPAVLDEKETAEKEAAEKEDAEREAAEEKAAAETPG